MDKLELFARLAGIVAALGMLLLAAIGTVAAAISNPTMLLGTLPLLAVSIYIVRTGNREGWQ